jgi:hypothetical protein
VANCAAALSMRGGLEQHIELAYQIFFQRASPSRVCVLLLVFASDTPCSERRVLVIRLERLRNLQLVLKGLPLRKSNSSGLRAVPSLPKLGLGMSQ